MRSKESKQSNVKQGEEVSHYLPPRKEVHHSEKRKWTIFFYQTLLWLFILLVVGLTVWGIRSN